MVKKPPSGGRGKRTGSPEYTAQFLQVAVRDSPDLGPVMIPVKSRNLSEHRRAQIIAEAHEFQAKGLFIQQCTSPNFLLALAQDFVKVLAPLQIQRRVAGQVVKDVLDCYFDRLQEALRADPDKTLKRTRAFLTVRVRKTRLGREKKDFVATFPDDYAESAISTISKVIARLFEKPTRRKISNFWTMYTRWIWTNQMAHAMEDLEERIGNKRLEQMKSERLFAKILQTYRKSGTVAPELARLTEWYLGEFARMVADTVRQLPLDELELVLLLRRHEAARVVVLADLGPQVDAVLKRPQEIYSVPSRRFEELIAFALSKSGYDVQLTPMARGGGFDINAVRHKPTRDRLIVECKRYSESRKVGRPILDALLGVLEREGANQALLATTSSFSKEALDLFKKEPWRLQGMDFENVMKLLRQSRRN